MYGNRIVKEEIEEMEEEDVIQMNNKTINKMNQINKLLPGLTKKKRVGSNK